VTRFLLVHGAFMGAWCWDPVVSALREAGHDVQAPDLPGSGSDDFNVADAELEAYIDRIGALLSPDEPAVLVGHSLGGVTISAAASRFPAAVAQLVYLAAFLPGDGQSAGDLTRLAEGRNEGLRPRMLVAGQPPIATLSAADARAVLFNACDPDLAEAAIARLGPHATWIAASPVYTRPDSSVRSAYIVCTKDLAVPPALQRRMARDGSCSPIVEIETDHSPFVSNPAVLVEALIGITGTDPQRSYTYRTRRDMPHVLQDGFPVHSTTR
jgi:pimeloyl-ACP methyl ester carboxylesterase